MTDKNIRTPHSMRYVFGLFMVFIYICMGALMFTDFVFWMPQWMRIFLGCMFVVYGFWRAYRQIRVIKEEREADKEEEEERKQRIRDEIKKM